MKTVAVEDAVGKVLCHDITQIVPGFFKGRAFKKGCIIQPEDIPTLLDLGKAHLFVLDLQAGMIHENEAAQRIAAAAMGGGLTATEPVEGKVNLVASRKGLLTIDTEALYRINDIEDIMGSEVVRQVLVSDDVDMAVAAIKGLISDGADFIVVTGGMSVDPDDQTPASIRAAGGKVTTYGAPVLPGTMFMLAHVDQVPVLGLPGCVMVYKASIFDLVVPRMLAGETLCKADIVAMGHGGFCSNCPDCKYPICAFGKTGS
jgi:hypothetical protein